MMRGSQGGRSQWLHRLAWCLLVSHSYMCECDMMRGSSLLCLWFYFSLPTKIRVLDSKTPPMGQVTHPCFPHITLLDFAKFSSQTQNIYIWGERDRREGKKVSFHSHLQKGPNWVYWVEKRGDPIFCHAPKDCLHSHKKF